MRVAAAAVLYFVIVFGVGFLLGPIRVLWLEPLVGPIIAVVCESPFVLTAMVVAARWVPRAVQLPQDSVSLALMGVGALVLQQGADFIVGIGLRGISPSQQLAHFASLQGMIYATLLAVFVVMPLIVNRQSVPVRN